MDTPDEPVHVIIRLPYPRPEGYIDTQPVVWSEAMEKTLWQIIGQTKPTLVDWNAVSRQLGNVPVKFLIQHATVLYQTQLQDLHRIGEQQQQQQQQQQQHVLQSETAMSRQASTSSISRPAPPVRTMSREVATSPILPFTGETGQPVGVPSGTVGGSGVSLPTTTTSTNTNPESAAQSKAQASPSLSGSISTFPAFSAGGGGGGRPPSMSSSASTIRPVQPSSPSPSIRNTESNYSSTILSSRAAGGSSNAAGPGAGPAPSQPRSTRESQLFGIASHDRERRATSVTNSIMQQLQGATSPRDELGPQHVQEPAHPFHHGTLSASLQKSGFLEQAYKQSNYQYGVQTSSRTSPRSQTSIRSLHGGMEQPVYSNSGYQDNDRSSTISSASTPYSQSNSVSQIFEETSFFNQLSSNDSLSRGGGAAGGYPISRSPFQGSSASSPFAAGAPPPGSQGRFGLGFVDTTLHGIVNNNHQGSFLQSNMGGSTQRTTNMHRSILKTGDDNDTETSTDKDDDDDEVTSQDESEPLRQQIKQLHLEDVLAFLPIGGPSASGVLPEAGKRPDSRNEVPGYQRRTALGDKMPFQLDEELADLGTRPLEEILNHNDDDGDLGEDDDHGRSYGGRGDRVGLSNKGGGGIRFLDQYAGPGRIRGLGRDGAHGNVTRTSPERSGPNSRKSSAQNSVGSSFSDLSDSSVTQSAMEDAYLSGYNNSKMSLFMHSSTRN
ncbi:hypothetical protein MVEG_02527 [Podila verticillata NRRL 6337]|nr:hypothetical protein MVEG_02527 [Podila verticillata NRRL 6337]